VPQPPSAQGNLGILLHNWSSGYQSQCSELWRNRLKFFLLAYGALNAILYASLLPLWDGWDEPFHYGYVQQLSHHASFPVLRKTVLSAEIKRSLLLAPASHLVRRNLPFVTSFDEYFRKSEPERFALRHQLEELSPKSANADSDIYNYEAQQAPLAYLLLAPLDSQFSGVALLHRILLLRLICGIVSAVATGMFTLELAALLSFPTIFRISALFVVFSSQMFYASTTHVANDWLAIPIFTWVVIRGIKLYRVPGSRNVVMFAISLGIGLLTKAYFLSLVPFAVGCLLLICWARKVSWWKVALFAAALGVISVPWYARNLWLYQDLSGMQETTGGAPLGALMSAAQRLPWGKALVTTLRATMWSGNNSSNTFSSTVLDGMIALLMLAVGLYVMQRFRQRVSLAEELVIAAVISFSVGLAYKGVVTFWSSAGVGLIPAQWYVEALAPAVFCLLFAGLSRSGRVGRVVALAMVWLWVYVICATYLAKLIPFYSGYPEGSVRLIALLRWYGSSFAEPIGKLTSTAMVSAVTVFIMTAAVIASGLVLAVRLSVEIWTPALFRSTGDNGGPTTS
jgi:hypothetical protein